MSTPAPWVIMRVTRPARGTLQLPKVVAGMIGLDTGAPPPSNQIAFLDRGPGTLRVVSLTRSMTLAKRERRTGRVLDTVTPTNRLLYNLPRSVEQHLGLRRLAGAPEKSREMLDGVAWLVPASEWARYTAPMRREGKPRWKGRSPAHVHAVSQVIPNPFPGLNEPEIRIAPRGDREKSRRAIRAPDAPLRQAEAPNPSCA